MQIYEVGGAVRDALLGLPAGDRDWVVVGATPQQMLDAGFQPVGKDFPVFLHPRTHEEYALARTERKSGRGYHGFVFHTAPDVTLEEDLARRDLTINAIARGPDGTLVDPHGGRRDLAARVLQEFHVDKLFLAVAGMSSTAGLTEFNMEDAAVKKAMIASAKKVIALVDSSKLESRVLCSVCSFEHILMLITDAPPPPALREVLERNGVEIRLAE